MAKSIYSFAARFDTVWDATIKALEDSKLEVVGSNKETGEILAQRPMSLFSYGENVAIYVGKTDKELETLIEVISKALATNITATNWEEKLFDSLARILHQGGEKQG